MAFALKPIMFRVVFTIPFVVLFHFANAQVTLSADELKYFNACEDTLSKLIQLSVTAKEDVERLEINAHFSKLMDEVLNHDRSFAFPFDSLKKYRMLLSSEDKEVRMVTWNLPMNDKTQHYFGYVQHLDKTPEKNGAGKKWQLFKLEDKSDEIKTPENAVLNSEKWFGCYYYKIIDSHYKKKKKYTLLAWDGNSRITQKKLIDVLYFNSNGDPQFGDAIFEVNKEFNTKKELYPDRTGAPPRVLPIKEYKVKDVNVWQKRVIFEFKQGLTMSLKYDESSQTIIFDHLSPEESALRGQYQYYGPDLSLDALKFKKGKWHFVKDTDGRNDKKKVDKQYKDPTKDPNAPPQK